MSKGVYLSKNACATTPQEDTPVSMRIQASHTTVKALQCRLQDAYRRDDVRLVRRISVLRDLLTQQATVPVLCERWGSARPGSMPGRRPSYCAAWIAWATAMVEGAPRSCLPNRSNAWS